MAFLKKISSSFSDQELVERYRQTEDLDLLGEVYQRYMDLVYGVCLKYLKDRDHAQDSVMAIFEELVTKLKKHEVENFKAWLHTLAKNHCLMRLRSEKRENTVNFDVELVQSEEMEHLDGVLAKEENFRKLDHCMDRLQQEQKKTIELFYLKGKCYNEIAEETGMDWNKVRSLIQNGRRNLKICMEEQQLKTVLKNDAIKK
ncbi:MAG: RNA polymerase sigma factor [Flavisolibacter sp.]